MQTSVLVCVYEERGSEGGRMYTSILPIRRALLLANYDPLIAKYANRNRQIGIGTETWPGGCHPPSEREKIGIPNCLALYHESPDSGDLFGSFILQ